MFEIGDKVQITGFENIKDGDIGIVSKVDKEKNMFTVDSFNSECIFEFIIFKPEHLRRLA